MKIETSAQDPNNQLKNPPKIILIFAGCHVWTNLVGGFNPSEQYESVGVIIPNMMGKIIHMFQTTSQIVIGFYVHQLNAIGYKLLISPLTIDLPPFSTIVSSWSYVHQLSYHRSVINPMKSQFPMVFLWFPAEEKWAQPQKSNAQKSDAHFSHKTKHWFQWVQNENPMLLWLPPVLSGDIIWANYSLVGGFNHLEKY
jgi:hypothetical protein